MWIYELLVLLIFCVSLRYSGSATRVYEPAGDLDIDKFIEDYIGEVERTLKLTSEAHTIHKRSPGVHYQQLQGMDLLIGFKDEFNLPTKFSNDLILFSQCLLSQQSEQVLFAASLEATLLHPAISRANQLVLYRYQGGTWEMVDHKEVRGGVKLASEQVGDLIHIIVAEHDADENSGSAVYQVDRVANKLRFVQRLPTHFPSNAIMWKWEDLEVFAAIAISENPAGSEARYSTHSPVYRWLGSHFDIIDTLPTYNPRALAQFYIRNNMFIAVANFQDDHGDVRVDSEIFRLNVATDKFDLYQKLSTRAAVDIKYFCLQSSQFTESFLVYASAPPTDNGGTPEEDVTSIVYKLSDEEYFVPFQALRVPGIRSWLPVRHSQDGRESLSLVAACDDGLAIYQYNGWRFVNTGLYNDQLTLGPGAKSLNVFYHNGEALISAANKHSRGSDSNVFSPVLKYDSSVEDMQQEIDSWVQDMTGQLAGAETRMAALLEMAHQAPSVNDPVIHLGSELVLQDAQIELVETDLADTEVQHRLSRMDEQLAKLHDLVEELHDKIDKTTYPTLIIHEDYYGDTADIQCTQACLAEHLEARYVNGESLQQFLSNTISVNEPVELDTITFENLALNAPLDAKMINGHPVQALVDWSKDVVLPNGLKVEGDLELESDLYVGGKLDGVYINNGYQESTSPVKRFQSLNVSQLQLTDGLLSQLNFELFSLTTLKTEGSQNFSVFQDFERIEADEVKASAGLYKSGVHVDPSPFSDKQSQPLCEGQFCNEDNTVPLQARASGPIRDVESMNIANDEITVPHDFTIYGTLTIENGLLVAKDLIDSKHGISAKELLENGIQLDTTDIDTHVVFNSGIKAAIVHADTLNGVDLDSLVPKESSEPVVVTGKKEFMGDLVVEGSAQVTGTVNGVRLEDHARTDMKLDNLTVNRIISPDVQIDGKDLQQLVLKREDGRVFVDTLYVEEDLTAGGVMVRGLVNGLHLESLLQDTVYNDGNVYVITGKKDFLGELKIANLSSRTINEMAINLSPEMLWKKRLTTSKRVVVDSLFYNGQLDGVQWDEFGEWLKTEGEQTMVGSQDLNTMETEALEVVPSGTINSINIHRLLTQAVTLSDNVTLDHVVFEGPVSSTKVAVEGRLNGLKVPEDLVLTNIDTIQRVLAHKHVRGGMTVQGNLRPLSLLSNVDLSALCQLLQLTHTNLILSGNAKFGEEPQFSRTVNHNTWEELVKRAWFKEDNVEIMSPVTIRRAQFGDVVVTNVNSNNLEERLSKLISLSRDETVDGTFYLPKVKMLGDLEAQEGTFEGCLQGVNLEKFVKNVLLDGEDQEFSGVPDFDILIIDGVLPCDGLVNGLNLSQDVLRTDVSSNTLTGSLIALNLTTRSLKIPQGALIAGVDFDRWQKTAVRTSANNTVDGFVKFVGRFEPANGIRVEGLVNGVPWDEDHLLLVRGSQRVTGVKKFSSGAELSVESLQVSGNLNEINITNFYNKQVTTQRNSTITGHKRFSSALYAEVLRLPEMYQGYNLTWLDMHMGAKLPLAEYRTQQANMAATRHLADTSLASRVHYLKGVRRLKDLEGSVLFAYPLKAHNLTAVAAVVRHVNTTKLSLLGWSEEHNTFLDLPGSTSMKLRVVPLSVQSVTLPRGELAVYVTYNLNINNTLTGYGELFQLNGSRMNSSMVFGGTQGSRLLSFLDDTGRTCFVMVKDTCLVFCLTGKGRRVKLPSFSCQNITDMTLLSTGHAIYLLGLQTGEENLLLGWRLSAKRFVNVIQLPQFNPVSIAATMTTGPLVAVATRHHDGNAHPESTVIYRLDEETDELTPAQVIPSISPSKVLFASLPSGESALYITSDVPALPVEVLVYRGLVGYQRVAVDPTLPTPADLVAFTDHRDKHFVLVNSATRSCLLTAEFNY